MKEHRKLRVLFVSNMKGFSGGEIVLERLIQHNQAIESLVILPEGAFARRLSQRGIRVHPTQHIQKLSRGSKKVALLTLLRNVVLGNREVLRLAKHQRIDVVVANGFGLFVYCALAKLFRTQVVLIHHHPVLTPGTSDFKLSKYVAMMLNAIVCVSDAVKTSYRRAGAPDAKLITIRNGLDHQTLPDTEAAAPAVRRTYGLEKETVCFGLVATITPWKGHETFVQAVKFVKDQSTTRPFRCFIVGGVLDENEADRRFAESLKQTIKRENLEEVITFTGQLDFQTIYALLDVVLNCSVLAEPLGTTLYEGMAMKKIVVATAIGGSPEILEDNVSGYLLPPGNVEALGKKMIHIIDNYPQLSGIRESAYQQSRERFSVENMIENYNQLFRRLAREKS